MPWARAGDTSGTYPRLLAAEALPDAPPGAYPMMFGFVTLLATMSAAHTTDYIVGAGEVRRAGGEMHAWLLKAALKTGLLTKYHERVHGLQAYKLIDDPVFLHVRLKAEVEWEQQQRNDTNDLRLSIPVRERDGDLCRYCRVPVHWRGPKSPRKATLDHTVPKNPDGSRPAATVSTMVVACLSCNSEMKDAAGEERLPLAPAPTVPFYTPATATWLTNNGRPTRPTSADSDPADAGPRAALPSRQRPAQADTARAADSDPAPAGPRAAQGAPTSHAPPGVSGPSLIDQAEERDSAGTGRDGTGNPPFSGSDNPRNAGTARRRRSSRGRDHRPSPPGSQP
jgi:hypothetical protein